MSDTPDPHELQAWIRFSLETSIPSSVRRGLLSQVGMPQTIFDAPASQLARYLDPAQVSRLRQAPDAALGEQIEATLEWLTTPGHHLLTWPDRHYPSTLFDLHDPPFVLYAHGHLDCLQRPMLAVVGSRHPTTEGVYNAQIFSEYLAQRGWCVVSGMAVGIDGAAHQGALKATSGSGTIAVLGTGIDRIYPASHRSLAHQIAEHGLLLSQFPLGARGLRYHFPKRNHLVAALAQGVLVVEAAARSGSLITARLAAELGREVFAIPGSIHSPLSHGCHALIRQGAKLVESGQDILEELHAPQLQGLSSACRLSACPPPGSPETEEQSLGEHEDDPVRAALPAGLAAEDAELLYTLAHQTLDPDALQTLLGWPTDRFLDRITQLELAGHLERTSHNQLYRPRTPPSSRP